jgi:peptidoglycan/LPS O-acetylase OafA/YrhL
VNPESRLFTTPRPVPARLAPALAGSGLVLLALPVFAVAGWPLRGWALAAVLWVGAQALALLLARLPHDPGNLAASGVRGIGMSFRAFIVGIPLVAVTVADSGIGLAAALLYALAYTLELGVSLITFFGSEAKA